MLDPDPDQYLEPDNLYPDPRPIKVKVKVKSFLVDLSFQSGVIVYLRRFVIKSFLIIILFAQGGSPTPHPFSSRPHFCM